MNNQPNKELNTEEMRQISLNGAARTDTGKLGEVIETLLDEYLASLRSPLDEERASAIAKLLHLPEFTYAMRYAFKVERVGNLLVIFAFLQSTSLDKLIEYKEAIEAYFPAIEQDRVVINIVEFIGEESTDEEIAEYFRFIQTALNFQNKLKAYTLYCPHKSTYLRLKNVIESDPELSKIVVTKDTLKVIEVISPYLKPHHPQLSGRKEP